jgi:NAD(P)-dependent dehydrogenase (short-subunit alcohol dehydrogenase family)
LPLEGRVALVTGAARRIGRSIALRLAAEGADVVVNYRSSKADADEVVTEIRAAGRRALAWQADVTHGDEVARMMAEVERAFARLDILVNNAGTFFAGPFEELTEQQWDTILDTNLKSVPLRPGGRAAAPAQRPRRDHQHFFAGRPVGLAEIHPLLRFEGRRDHADALPGARARPADYRE